jgi:hypothetical protein
MPWLPIYAVEEDMRWLFDTLSMEPEVAFLVSVSDKRWTAVKRKAFAGDCRIGLWHVPSGPLPLLRERGQPEGQIDDAFAGWTEERTGAEPTTPYFGAGHFGVFWLNVRTAGRKKGAIGLSSFEWIGNRYASAPESTERFWKKLARIIKKQAIRVPREGTWDGPHPEIWALPEALKHFVIGRERDANP